MEKSTNKLTEEAIFEAENLHGENNQESFDTENESEEAENQEIQEDDNFMELYEESLHIIP